MRPIKLVMSAFGSFGDLVKIDFRNLKNENIFMISGPTGAGKTTIFDAISFALYGEGSGENRKDAQSFRSDYAKEETKTFVNFEFEINHKLYKIIRYPKQKTNDSKYELYIENEQPLIKDKEIKLKIEEILGISKEQFKQIVMIPQGEFKRFLISDTKEKQEIFRKLFGTQLYLKIQEDFKEMNKQTKEEYKVNENNIKTLIKALNFSEQIDDIEIAIKNTEEFLQTLSNELIQRRGCKEELENELNILHKNKAITEKYNILILQLEDINQELEKLKTKSIKMHQLKNKIKILAVVKENLFTHNYIQNQLKEYKSKNEEKIQHENEKINLEKNIKINQELFQKYSMDIKNHDELKLKKKELENLIPKIAETEQLNKELEQLKQKLNDKNIDKLEIDKKIAKNKSQTIELKEIIEEFNSIEIKKIELENTKIQKSNSRDQLANLYKICNGYQKQLNEHEKLSKDYILKNIEYEKKKLEYETAEKLYYDEQAGILALTLQEGLPCIVCGSTIHPNPNIIKSDIKVPTKVELSVIKKEFENLQKENQDIKNKLIELNTSQKTTLEVILSSLDCIKEQDYNSQTLPKIIEIGQNLKLELIYIDKELLIITDKLLDKNTKIAKLEILEKNFSDLEIEKENIAQDLKNLEIEQAKIQKLQEERDILSNSKNNMFLSQLQEQVQIIDSRILNEQKLYEESNVNLINLKEKLVKRDTIIEEYNNQLTSLEVKINIENNNLLEKLKENQLSEDDFIKLLPEISNIEDLQSQLQEYDAHLTALNIKKQQFEEQIDNRVYIDLNIFEEKIQKATDKKNYLEKQINIIIRNENSKRTILAQIEQEHEKHIILRRQYELIKDVGDVANGQNAFYISYEAYVLGEYFDDIINAANIRLKQMSSNRFLLTRQLEKTKGRKQKGLDIAVFDKYTNSIRDAKTLSGGESFKASLSLALGLSDIIQAKSGGIRLDTMFIDEGFGTLDYDALGMAVETLIGLQTDGRLIGIISHVEELKEKIPIKLEVRPSNHGSTVRWNDLI
ncbi:hypothetical protein AN641_03345 [Candidatus Epulonipiscioides gigas]|nr:hypothetical protein AN641_03345 [Epulopiscium sp. SCG-C07WGA-EpuloA2]